jgi:hypothetical protein
MKILFKTCENKVITHEDIIQIFDPEGGENSNTKEISSQEEEEDGVTNPILGQIP